MLTKSAYILFLLNGIINSNPTSASLMSIPGHKLKVTPGIGMTKDGTTENQVHQSGQVMMILRMLNSFPVKNPVITTPS